MEGTWAGFIPGDYPELRAPNPDEHGEPLDFNATIELLRQAKQAKDELEARGFRALAKITARLWKPEELERLKEALLADEELWDEIPGLLE